MSTPRKLLLVGSVPMPTARDVFEACAATLGDLLTRMPDGEIGPRLNWILCQQEMVANAVGLELGEVRHLQGGYQVQRYKLPEGADPWSVAFGPLGYAQWAKESYAEFSRLKERGAIPKAMRFQVSLPSPLDVCWSFFPPQDQTRMWPVYEQAMTRELGDIVAAIPNEELAIQWDMSTEFQGIMEDPAEQERFAPKAMAEAIARLSDHVPSAAELGLHCCYGDPGHKHLVEPTDMSNLVALGGLMLRSIRRPVSWIHMPVPKERDDDAYFAPLEGFDIPEGTEFYLGLVHITDKLDGAKRRLAAAKKVVTEFGIATECGFGRRPSETIPELLALHRDVANLG